MKQNTNKIKKLTRRQKQIIDYLRSIARKRGYPPSIREICESLNLRSSSTVHNHLCNLEKKGYIKREPSKPRSIELIKIKKKPREGIDEKFLASIPGTPLREIKKNKALDYLSGIILEAEDDAILSFLVEGEKFSSFGINNQDLIFITQSEKLNEQNLVIVNNENKELLIGYYSAKAKGHYSIKINEGKLINIGSDNLLLKIVCIVKAR